MTDDDDLRRARDEGKAEGAWKATVEADIAQLKARVRLILVVVGGAIMAVSKQIWDAISAGVFK
jgi:hypothetical protein